MYVVICICSTLGLKGLTATRALSCVKDPKYLAVHCRGAPRISASPEVFFAGVCTFQTVLFLCGFDMANCYSVNVLPLAFQKTYTLDSLIVYLSGGKTFGEGGPLHGFKTSRPQVAITE